MSCHQFDQNGNWLNEWKNIFDEKHLNVQSFYVTGEQLKTIDK